MMKNMIFTVSCLFASSVLMAMDTSPALQKTSPAKFRAMKDNARQHGATMADLLAVQSRINAVRERLDALESCDIQVSAGVYSPRRRVVGERARLKTTVFFLEELRDALIKNYKPQAK